MNAFPVVVRHEAHYEIKFNIPVPPRPSESYVWDVDLGQWVRDGYAMILLSRYLREQRDLLLQEALNVLDRHDKQVRYGVTPSLTEPQIRIVAQYAQTLRDVPQQSGFPHTVEWPIPPLAVHSTVDTQKLRSA